jgi:hypothetical protein
MNWLGKLFTGARKPRTLLNQAQEAAGILIVGGYRRLAASQGCAPTSKTSDQKIIEIYQKVGTAFREAAVQRRERIPAGVMNSIVWNFLQIYEFSGDAMVEAHLADELQNYSQQGLRPDYNHDLDLVGINEAEILAANMEQPNLFDGGTGDAFETAVVVNAQNPLVGVQAEYTYIANHCGQPHKDWKLQWQALREYGGKAYDVLTIALTSGETRTFYFDIAKFLGK